MIQQLFIELGPWSWVILGLLLLVLELIAPGTMFLWFGIAAILVGFVNFAIDMGWQNAFILFGVLSLISVIIGRMVMRRTANTATDKPLLNERVLSLVGKSYRLTDPIVDGKGRVKINDSYWRISGPDCAAGSKVIVTGGDGALLEVELAE